MKLFACSAKQLHEHFIKGDFSAQQIIEYFFQRIQTFDPMLKAFLCPLYERSLKKAQLLDQKRAQNKPLGKLAAIPIAIKDNMHIQDVITTCGSKFLENYKAPFSASVTEFLEEEDAILIGKTNLDEFAMGSSSEHSAYFPSHNPWNLECSPGGSSSGSAVAVAARLAPLSLGSDTGGSIRQPASFCGIVGFKPTYGRVSRYGLVSYGSSFDQIGPFATNALDIGLCMEVIGKHCKNDSTSLPLPQENYTENLYQDLSHLTIGIPWHFIEAAPEKTLKNFKESVQILKDLNAKIIDIDLSVLKHSIATYYILACAEASTNLARFDGVRYGLRQKANDIDSLMCLSRNYGFGHEVKQRIMLGTYVLSSGYQDAYYKKAQKVRTKIIQDFEKAFALCDVISMPTSPTTAFKLQHIQDPIEMYLQDIFTISANLAGLPAISAPCGLDENQLPYGVQFLAPQALDTLLVKMAHLFETKTKSNEFIPPLFNKESEK